MSVQDSPENVRNIHLTGKQRIAQKLKADHVGNGIDRK